MLCICKKLELGAKLMEKKKKKYVVCFQTPASFFYPTNDSNFQLQKALLIYE